MEQYISKSDIVEEIERRKSTHINLTEFNSGYKNAIFDVLSFIDTLEVKEVDIASMADDYYDALIKEAEMGVDMAGHCRLAYYNGCKDVLNKIRKGD